MSRWRRVLTRPFRVVRFLLFYARSVLAANLLVAREVITPSSGMRPGIVRVPVHGTERTQLVLLANLISLTPGTLTVDVDRDESALYVHGLHLTDADSFRSHLGELERRMLEGLW